MIAYSDDLDGITADDVSGGFWVGWPNPPTPETHLRILHGSDHVFLARDGVSGVVVGFITAISDGVLFAYIPLLEVLPAWQGQGIGGELVRRMLERLRHLYAIDLLCDPEVQPFYERHGLRRSSGMIARNYARQSGADAGS